MDREDWIAHISIILFAIAATWITYMVDPVWTTLYGAGIAYTVLVLVWIGVMWWLRWDHRRDLRRMDEMFQRELRRAGEEGAEEIRRMGERGPIQQRLAKKK